MSLTDYTRTNEVPTLGPPGKPVDQLAPILLGEPDQPQIGFREPLRQPPTQRLADALKRTAKQGDHRDSVLIEILEDLIRRVAQLEDARRD